MTRMMDEGHTVYVKAFAESEVLSFPPQCSVIDPLLFLLYVNDLPQVLEALTVLFVGDVELRTLSDTARGSASSLTAAWGWLNKLDLRINPAKCN